MEIDSMSPFWLDYTPCGKPIYVTEMSTWAKFDYRDPITGRPCKDEVKLEKKFVRDELRYFVGLAPSGVFLRIFNA